MNRPHMRPAFTIVELMVVLAIIGVMLALLLGALQRVRGAAERLQCAVHLQQIGLALHQYHDSQGSLPPGCSYEDGKAAQPAMSWMTRLLPYLDQNALWQESLGAYAQNPLFQSPPHFPIISRVMPIFSCPSDSRLLVAKDFGTVTIGLTSYLGVEGSDQTSEDGLLYRDSAVRFVEIRDGLSNTLAVGERPPSADQSFGWWYGGIGQQQHSGSCDTVLSARETNSIGFRYSCPPGPYHYGPGQIMDQCAMFHFWSLHIGGGNFLFADGSVRFLNYNVDDVLPALATRDGGETAPTPD